MKNSQQSLYYCPLTIKQSRVTLQLSRHAKSQQLLYNCPDTQTVNSYSTIVQTRKQSTVTLQLSRHSNSQQLLYNCPDTQTVNSYSTIVQSQKKTVNSHYQNLQTQDLDKWSTDTIQLYGHMIVQLQ